MFTRTFRKNIYNRAVKRIYSSFNQPDINNSVYKIEQNIKQLYNKMIEQDINLYKLEQQIKQQKVENDIAKSIAIVGVGVGIVALSRSGGRFD